MNTDETNYLDAAEFAAILSTTLAMANEAGVQLGIRNAAANERRPAGLLIYLGGLELDEEGRLKASAESIATESES